MVDPTSAQWQLFNSMLLEGDILTRVVRAIDPKLCRSENELFRLKLRNNGAVYTMGVGESVTLVMKPWGKADSSISASCEVDDNDFHEPSGEYRKSFSTSTAGVLQELRVNANTTDDKLEAYFSATLVYVAIDTPSSLYPIQAILLNSDYTGVLSVPASVSPFINPGFWTSIDDGSDTALNSVITADGVFPVGNTINTAIGGVYQVWQLQTNTGLIASDGINFQRPLDYNAVTNNVIWVKIS
jgi:hypothetical protein